MIRKLLFSNRLHFFVVVLFSISLFAHAQSNFGPPPTPTPTIVTTGTNAITALAACLNTTSAAQTFTVRGSDLTQNIVITSSDPTNIEFSLTGNPGSYSDILTLTPTTGTVTSKTVYIRQKSSATVGSNSRTVSNLRRTRTSAGQPGSQSIPLPDKHRGHEQ